MTNTEDKTAFVQLPYRKAGDDLLQHYLQTCEMQDALIAYSHDLTTASDVIRQFANAIQDHEVSLIADGHDIEVFGEPVFIESLVEMGLAKVVRPNGRGRVMVSHPPLHKRRLEVELIYPGLDYSCQLEDNLRSYGTVRKAFFKLASYVRLAGLEEEAAKTEAIGEILTGHDEDLEFDTSYGQMFATGPTEVMRQLLRDGLAHKSFWDTHIDFLNEEDHLSPKAWGNEFGEWAKDQWIDIENVEFPFGSVVSIAGPCNGVVPFVGDLYDGQVALGIETSERDQYEIIVDTNKDDCAEFRVGYSLINHDLEGLRKVRAYDSDVDSKGHLSEEDIMFMSAGTIAQRNRDVRKLLSMSLSKIPANIAKSVLRRCLVIVLDDEGHFICNYIRKNKDLIVLPSTIWELPDDGQVKLLLRLLQKGMKCFYADETVERWLKTDDGQTETTQQKAIRFEHNGFLTLFSFECNGVQHYLCREDILAVADRGEMPDDDDGRPLIVVDELVGFVAECRKHAESIRTHRYTYDPDGMWFVERRTKFGLRDEDLGRKFFIDDEPYAICGIRKGARTYPIAAVSLIDGKKRTVTVEAVSRST